MMLVEDGWVVWVGDPALKQIVGRTYDQAKVWLLRFCKKIRIDKRMPGFLFDPCLEDSNDA